MLFLDNVLEASVVQLGKLEAVHSLSLFHMKISTSFTKGLHQDGCPLHLPKMSNYST